jgi:hypothetical protein
VTLMSVAHIITTSLWITLIVLTSLLSKESFCLYEFPFGMVSSLIFVYIINEHTILWFEKCSLSRGAMTVTQLWITHSYFLGSPYSVNDRQWRHVFHIDLNTFLHTVKRRTGYSCVIRCLLNNTVSTPGPVIQRTEPRRTPRIFLPPTLFVTSELRSIKPDQRYKISPVYL